MTEEERKTLEKNLAKALIDMVDSAKRAEAQTIRPGDVLRLRFVKREDSATYKYIGDKNDMFDSLDRKKELVVFAVESIGQANVILIEGVPGLWLGEDFDVVGHKEECMSKRNEALNILMRENKAIIGRNEAVEAIVMGVSNAIAKVVMNDYNATVSVSEIQLGVIEALTEFLAVYEKRKRQLDSLLEAIASGEIDDGLEELDMTRTPPPKDDPMIR